MAERVMSARITTPTIDAVERCTQFAAAQAHEAGFSLARVREIELVVEEVITNICQHSYGDHPGSVELFCERLDEANLALKFIDYGRPFNILALPMPNLAVDLDQRDVGGIGVPMFRALVDHATYRREDLRNILRVIVHAAPKLRSDPAEQ